MNTYDKEICGHQTFDVIWSCHYNSIILIIIDSNLNHNEM